jgi:uncharacterized paraquat-inducible protein A
MTVAERIKMSGRPLEAQLLAAPIGFVKSCSTLAKLPNGLTSAMEDALERDMMKKWTHLEVYAVGTDVTLVKVGDSVYVPSSSLQSADLIELDDLSTKMMISEREIAIIW